MTIEVLFPMILTIMHRDAPTLKSSTILSYFLGRADAIRSIAACPSTIGLGLLFVLSAGLAREYDGEYLFAKPWYAILPLAASLATATILFHLFYLCSLRNSSPRYRDLFRAFLGLYWMTAPLAWLYAIPYERFLSGLDAVRMNLWTLLFVSVVRVVLMIRVGHVLFGFPVSLSSSLVLLFGDGVLLAALFASPMPVIDFMGGIHTISETSQFIGSTHLLTSFVSLLAFPVLFFAALMGVIMRKSYREPVPALPPVISTSWQSWALAGGSVLLGFLLLTVGQPEQCLRYYVEESLHSGRIDEGVAILAAHERGDFPPHWDPPPRPDWREDSPEVSIVLERVLRAQAPRWVIETYTEKWKFQLTPYLAFGSPSWDSSRTEADIRRSLRHVRILERLPESARIPLLKKRRQDWERLLGIIPRDAPENHRLRDLLGVDADWMPPEPGSEYRRPSH